MSRKEFRIPVPVTPREIEVAVRAGVDAVVAQREPFFASDTPKPPAEQSEWAGGSGTSEEPSDPPKQPIFSPRQYGILEALLNLGAVDAEKRRTTDEVAKAAEGPHVNPEGFKAAVSELKKMHGLIDTKPSRGGGCWLSPKGKTLIEGIIASRTNR